jgi:hypothetical protein
MSSMQLITCSYIKYITKTYTPGAPVLIGGVATLAPTPTTGLTPAPTTGFAAVVCLAAAVAISAKWSDTNFSAFSVCDTIR